MCCSRSQLCDIGNIFKAFIGSNYLSFPFAFREGGLVLSIITVICVAFVTDHCCALLVENKRVVLRRVHLSLSEFARAPTSQASPRLKGFIHRGHLQESLERKVQMRHIASYILGSCGETLVVICLFITQFGFCTGYFIFIGNTLMELVKPRLAGTEPNEDWMPSIIEELNNVTVTPTANPERQPWLLYVLVACPLPLFMLFAFVRNMRRVAVISLVANVAVLGGYVVISGHMLHGFSLADDVAYFQWKTFPIFLGLIFGALEGIGTILNIEAGMMENRHHFHLFLHLSLGLVTGIFLTFGSLGYLRYGSTTGQIIIQNLPHSPVSILVDVTLVVAVACTFPLQLAPVLDIVEHTLFTSTVGRTANLMEEVQSLGPSSSEFAEFGALREEMNGLNAVAMPHQDSNERFSTSGTVVTSAPVTNELLSLALDLTQRVHSVTQHKTQVARWKRYSVRLLVVLCQMVLALVAKDVFAYFGSLVGALGASFLSYVFPCWSHLRLHGVGMSRAAKFKDVIIIVLTTVASLLSIGMNALVLFTNLEVQ